MFPPYVHNMNIDDSNRYLTKLPAWNALPVSVTFMRRLYHTYRNLESVMKKGHQLAIGVKQMYHNMKKK